MTNVVGVAKTRSGGVPVSLHLAKTGIEHLDEPLSHRVVPAPCAPSDLGTLGNLLRRLGSGSAHDFSLPRPAAPSPDFRLVKLGPALARRERPRTVRVARVGAGAPMRKPRSASGQPYCQLMGRGRRPSKHRGSDGPASDFPVNDVRLLGRLERTVAAVSDPHGPDVAFLTVVVDPAEERIPVRAYGVLAHHAAEFAAGDLVAVRGALRQLPVTHVEASSIEVRTTPAPKGPRHRASSLACA